MERNARHRGVIKRDQVHIDGHDGELDAPRGAATPRAAGGAPCARPPAVRLVQLDERTQAFEFTCSCGEVSLIEIQHEKKP
jgi:hypothetical protein